MQDIVTAEWLSQNLNKQDLILLDASLEATVDGKPSAFSNLSIPDARFFDLKVAFSDAASPFPNTIPPPAVFEQEARNLGINKDSKIVVFDNMGIYSSPRVWWMFKTMGHEEIAVLDGGLPDWVNSGKPVVSKTEHVYQQGDFVAHFQKEYLKTYEEIEQNVDNPAFQIVDARSKGRFDGTAKEPRQHLKSGHIPNSVNIPYQEVLKNGKFKSVAELKRIFQETCDSDKEQVFSCGSGLTACIIMLAGEISYKRSKMVYDGSWTEWAELQNLKE